MKNKNMLIIIKFSTNFSPPMQTISLDELLDKIGFRCYHYIVIIILSIVTIADVMETEVGILLGPTLLCEWKLTGLQEAMSTSSLYVGALVGSLLWGTVADKYGRKDTLIIMLLWIGVFGICTSFSNSLVPYVILRLLTGVGVGGAFLPVTYATEMVNAKSRSFATLIIFFAAFIGTILASTLAMFILPLTDGWKWYIIASSILVIVSSFFVAAFVPESPRYLLLTGNHKGVIKVLRKFDKTLDEETYHYLEVDKFTYKNAKIFRRKNMWVKISCRTFGDTIDSLGSFSEKFFLRCLTVGKFCTFFLHTLYCNTTQSAMKTNKTT